MFSRDSAGKQETLERINSTDGSPANVIVPDAMTPMTASEHEIDSRDEWQQEQDL